MATPDILKATHEHADAIADVLAAAFDDDPLINWMVRQDARRQEAIRLLFHTFATRTYIGQGETYLLDSGEGAAMWAPPGGRSDVSPVQALMLLPKLLRMSGLGRARTAFQVAGFMSKRHPKEPHFYLMAIGAQPEVQGQGRGSALMEHVTERLDREGIPAYLENSKERNLPFYERHGFVVREAADAPGGGPPVWFMWRDPVG